MNQTKISKYISIGVRVTALLLLLFFFLPSICVSCSGVDENISGFNAAIGVEVELDEDMMDPIETDPAVWLFLIPVCAILIAIIANKKHIVSMVCAACGIILMIAFKIGVNLWVKDYFEDYADMVSVEAKAVYVFYIIFSILIVAALSFEKYVLFNDVNRAKLEKILGKNNAVSNSVTATPTVATSAVKQIFCPNCGKANRADSSFCSECGTALPTIAASGSENNPNQ